MTTEQPIIEAIHADPDDKLPRLVWCDYLEETGAERQGQLFRQQILNDERDLTPRGYSGPFTPFFIGWGGLPDVLVTNWETFRVSGPNQAAEHPLRIVILADLVVQIRFRRVYDATIPQAYSFEALLEAPDLFTDRPLVLPSGERRLERVRAREGVKYKATACASAARHARRRAANDVAVGVSKELDRVRIPQRRERLESNWPLLLRDPCPASIIIS